MMQAIVINQISGETRINSNSNNNNNNNNNHLKMVITPSLRGLTVTPSPPKFNQPLAIHSMVLKIPNRARLHSNRMMRVLIGMGVTLGLRVRIKTPNNRGHSTVLGE